MKKRPTPKQMETACAKWNAANQVGAEVEYWPGIRSDAQPPRSGKTSTVAQVLGGHTAGVYVEPGGFIALDHVRAA
jgi:hypothetical protein